MTKRIYPKAGPDRAELFTRSGPGVGYTFPVNFGGPQLVTAQSGLAYIRIDGTNAGAIIYIAGRVSNGTTTGFRWFFSDNAGQPQMAVGFTSTGTAGSPNVTNTSILHKYGQWYAVAYSHDGSITAANIAMYSNSKGNTVSGPANTPMVLMANSTSSNGTTAFDNDNGRFFTLGDRAGGARNWVGAIAYFARWNRVLTLNELEQARIYGPLSITNGLITLWSNGKDWSPYQLNPTNHAPVTTVNVPPFVRLGPASRRYGSVPALWPKIIGLKTTGTWKTNVGLLVSSQIKTRAGTPIASIKTSNGLTR